MPINEQRQPPPDSAPARSQSEGEAHPADPSGAATGAALFKAIPDIVNSVTRPLEEVFTKGANYGTTVFGAVVIFWVMVVQTTHIRGLVRLDHSTVILIVAVASAMVILGTLFQLLADSQRRRHDLALQKLKLDSAARIAAVAEEVGQAILRTVSETGQGTLAAVTEAGKVVTNTASPTAADPHKPWG